MGISNTGKVRNGQLENDARKLVLDHVSYTIDEYLYASRQEKLG